MFLGALLPSPEVVIAVAAPVGRLATSEGPLRPLSEVREGVVGGALAVATLVLEVVLAGFSIDHIVLLQPLYIVELDSSHVV